MLPTATVSINTSKRATRENEYIPKNVDADVEHGHEEADALEKVANK
jgi:hypothetical protein